LGTIPLTLTSIQEVYSTVVDFVTRNVGMYNIQHNNISVTFIPNNRSGELKHQ